MPAIEDMRVGVFEAIACAFLNASTIEEIEGAFLSGKLPGLIIKDGEITGLEESIWEKL